MLHPILSALINETHHRDFLAEAQAAHRNGSLEHPAPPWRRQAMGHAGDLLVTAGTKLRERAQPVYPGECIAS